MTHPSRRAVLAGAAATAATAGFSAQAQRATRHPNLFSVLGQTGTFGGRNWRFLGADGQEVDIAALQQQLAGYHTTAYITFAACTQFCGLTNSNMKTLSEDAATQGIKLKHLFINAIPENEGFGPLRESTLDMIEHTGLKPFRPGRSLTDSDAIVLFTTTNGTEQGLSNPLVSRLSEALGNHTRHDSPQDHSPVVNLYAPGGRHIGRGMGTSPTIASDLLAHIRSSGPAR